VTCQVQSVTGFPVFVPLGVERMFHSFPMFTANPAKDTRFDSTKYISWDARGSSRPVSVAFLVEGWASVESVRAHVVGSQGAHTYHVCVCTRLGSKCASARGLVPRLNVSIKIATGRPV
jgi:hypothetical protein